MGLLVHAALSRGEDLLIIQAEGLWGRDLGHNIAMDLANVSQIWKSPLFVCNFYRAQTRIRDWP